MYETYWGLSSPPFDNRLSASAFYESPLHEEALARLFYCIEEHRFLAVLHGPAGCGKTQVLSILADQVRRTQRFLAAGSLANFDEHDFFRLLDRQFRLGGTDADALGTCRRRVLDFFQSTADSGLQTVLILEGLEHAEDSTIIAIRRLADLHNQNLANLTIILSVNPHRLTPIARELLEIVEMGVALPPLEREQTESYVQKRLEAAGSGRNVFQADAIDELQQLTGGIPRELNRLCDLAMLAGMDENRNEIDGDLITHLAGLIPFVGQGG